MAIDPKEALGMMGYDPEAFETPEDFKAKMEEDWVKTSEAHLNQDLHRKVMGKANGSMVAKAKQYAKQMGLDVEVKTDAALEAWETVIGAAESKYKSLEEQFTEVKKTKGSGKEVEELTAKYSELQNKLKTEQELRAEAASKYEELDNAIKSRDMNAKIDSIYSRAEEGLKFKEGISKFELDGFRSFMRKNFPVKFDEDGKEYVTDANGERIKDEKKVGQVKDLATIYKEFAEKEKLTGGIPQGGAPVRRTLPMSSPGTPQPQQPPQGARPTRTVMPR